MTINILQSTSEVGGLTVARIRIFTGVDWKTPLQETTASQLAVISVGCGWRLHGMMIIMLYCYYSYSTTVAVGI
jgi:hypothetical protein